MHSLAAGSLKTKGTLHIIGHKVIPAKILLLMRKEANL